MARLAWLGVLLLAACAAPTAGPTATPGQPTPTEQPTAAISPTPTNAPTPTTAPSPTDTPSASSPSATVAPTVPTSGAGLRELSAGPLQPGRYTNSSADPQLILEVPEGWETIHLEPGLYDVAQVTDAETRAVGFVTPTIVYGPTEGAAPDSVEDAVELLRQNSGLEVSDARPITFAGLDGIEVDVAATAADTNVLGDDERVLLGIGPADDTRLQIVDYEDEIFIVLLVAPNDGMDDWAVEAAPLLESASLAFPSAAVQPLAQGRYSSSPPFDVPFTFEVIGEDWESGHLHGDFFDLLQIPGAAPGTPSRWIAFGLPTVIHGDPDMPASDLTPAEAADLLAARIDLETSEPSDVAVAGLDGTQIDLRTMTPETHIFGGPGGDFGLGPEHDARLAMMPWDDGLLLFLVLATAGELEEAWDEALPILDSVELEAQ